MSHLQNQNTQTKEGAGVRKAKYALQCVSSFSLVFSNFNRILRLKKCKGFSTTFLGFIIFSVGHSRTMEVGVKYDLWVGEVGGQTDYHRDDFIRNCYPFRHSPMLENTG